MKKLLFILLLLPIFCVSIEAQAINQAADPGLVAVFQSPNTLPNVGDMGLICARVTNAGTELIPDNTIIVTMSWGTLSEFISDNNVVAQGWTIFQSSVNSVSMRNTTDEIDPANFDIKDLCVNVMSVREGISVVGANISRAFGVSSTVGNAQTANDNAQSGFQVLPVELTYFKGKSNDCTTRLEWRTESEQYNDYFEVQHSLDGKNFEARAKMQGAGTSLEPIIYDFTDTKAVEGTNYYRLKQVDESGYYEYLKVIAIDNYCGKERVLEIYPNPVGADENLTVNVYDDNMEVELFIKDFQNRTIQYIRQEVNFKGQHQIEINVSDLPSGMYFLIDEYGKKMKFVKMRN